MQCILYATSGPPCEGWRNFPTTGNEHDQGDLLLKRGRHALRRAFAAIYYKNRVVGYRALKIEFFTNDEHVIALEYELIRESLVLR